MAAPLPPLQFVGLGHDRDHPAAVLPQEFPEEQLLGGRKPAAVLEEDYRRQRLPAGQIFQHQRPPTRLEVLRYRGIAEARQVHEIPALVDQKKIQGPGAARPGTGAHQFFPPQQAVDQGGFAHIGAPQKGHLRQPARGALIAPVGAQGILGGDNLGDSHSGEPAAGGAGVLVIIARLFD